MHSIIKLSGNTTRERTAEHHYYFQPHPLSPWTVYLLTLRQFICLNYWSATEILLICHFSGVYISCDALLQTLVTKISSVNRLRSRLVRHARETRKDEVFIWKDLMVQNVLQRFLPTFVCFVIRLVVTGTAEVLCNSHGTNNVCQQFETRILFSGMQDDRGLVTEGGCVMRLLWQ